MSYDSPTLYGLNTGVGVTPGYLEALQAYGGGLNFAPKAAMPQAHTLADALGQFQRVPLGASSVGAFPTSTSGYDPTFMDRMVGWKDPKSGIDHAGWGGMALGTATSLGNLYMGLKQYGLAKDSLAFQKDAYAKNYTAQMKTTNAELSDRQARRVQENPNAMSVSEYMGKYGLV